MIQATRRYATVRVWSTRCAPLLVIGILVFCAYRIYHQLHLDQLDQAMIQAIVDGKEHRALILSRNSKYPDILKELLHAGAKR